MPNKYFAELAKKLIKFWTPPFSQGHGHLIVDNNLPTTPPSSPIIVVIEII